MQGIEITEQPSQEVEVDKMFSFSFFCPFTTLSFSNEVKWFNRMNSFATAKLVNLETDEDHEDEAYILGQSRVTFANNVADRIIRFQIGIRVPGEYRILISLHGKTSSPDTSLHYSVQADLLTEVICVCFSNLWLVLAIRSAELKIQLYRQLSRSRNQFVIIWWGNDHGTWLRRMEFIMIYPWQSSKPAYHRLTSGF